ncbi:MAG: B-box zinc finger protein [Acidobacteriota bacterium]
MSEPANLENWQVEVGGQIYEADFGELAAWVAEGALQPDDKVRRGNLRWIEAKRVPTLLPHFNARRDCTPPPPVVVTTTTAAETAPAAATPAASVTVNVAPPQPVQVVVNATQVDPDSCRNHQSVPAVYICETCDIAYCKGCPSSYGGSVKICPACGGLCKEKAQAAASKKRDEGYRQALDQGFGLSDLGAAFAHPFKFKLSLFFGALMYMFFSLGQSATAMGGIFMYAAAIISFMLANMLWFGVLAHTTESFSQGKLSVDFMPRFDEFNLWDDVVHPFFLSIGVYISAFGLFLVMAIVGGYMVYNAMAAEQQAMLSQIQKLPGSTLYDPQKPIQQSGEVSKVLSETKRQNDERLQTQADIANGSQPAATSAGDTEESVMRANETIQKVQKAQVEAAIGRSPQTQTDEREAFLKKILGLAAPVVVLAGIGLLWGLFYFPAACAVAGYTRSFMATINPLVGLDTIRRLGLDYFKLLFMALVIVICVAMVSFILDLIFSPFSMPGFVNIPARIVGSLFSFYFWAVFCCLIGFMLYKASDRLKLYK